MANFSLIVIGRNSATHLQKLWSREIVFGEIERIYVDSRSSDQSVEIAQQKGFHTVSLLPSEPLSAASGRHVGAKNAMGEWLLFCDSDMELQLSIPLEKLIEELEEQGWSGCSGATIDLFSSGERIERRRREKSGEVARYFGGLVLLHRQTLLNAGNYNPRLIANEEIELYARIIRNKGKICYRSELACLHHTEKSSKWEELRQLYRPTGVRRERWGAPGWAARAAQRSGTLPILVRLAPEHFLFWPILLLAAIQFLIAPFGSLLIITLFSLWVIRRRSLPYLAALPSLAIQLIYGWRGEKRGEK